MEATDIWTIFEVGVRLGAGSLLAVAGIWMLSSTLVWRQVWLTSYRLLPIWLVRPVALLLPLVEVALGAAVLAGALGSGALFAASILYCLLAVAAAVALAHGEHLPHDAEWYGLIAHRRVVARNGVLAAGLALVAQRGLSGPSVQGVAWQAQAALAAVLSIVALASVRGIHLWQRRRFVDSWTPAALAAPPRTTDRAAAPAAATATPGH